MLEPLPFAVIDCSVIAVFLANARLLAQLFLFRVLQSFFICVLETLNDRIFPRWSFIYSIKRVSLYLDSRAHEFKT